jgi:hypothetical protein
MSPISSLATPTKKTERKNTKREAQIIVSFIQNLNEIPAQLLYGASIHLWGMTNN